MGYTIERIQVGQAYAANGNLHNPTKYYRYNVRLDGKLIGSVAKRRDAVEWIAGLKAEENE